MPPAAATGSLVAGIQDGRDENGQALQRPNRRRHPSLAAGLGAVPPAGRAARVAERPLHRPRRRRLLGDGALGRGDRDPQYQPPGRERPHLHELAHDRTLLADALLAAHRAQPHDERDGVHRRGDDRLPQRQRPHPVRVRDDRRGARRARLEHLHARQVAPLRLGRDEPGLDEAQLAGRPRLRALLRLPRRGDEPVVPRPRLRQTTRPAAAGAKTNQWSPALVYDNPPVEQPAMPEDGYHLTTDLTDKAIEFVKDAKAIAAEKPFFMYFCPGATPAPPPVSKE